MRAKRGPYMAYDDEEFDGDVGPGAKRKVGGSAAAWTGPVFLQSRYCAVASVACYGGKNSILPRVSMMPRQSYLAGLNPSCEVMDSCADVSAVVGDWGRGYSSLGVDHPFMPTFVVILKNLSIRRDAC